MHSVLLYSHRVTRSKQSSTHRRTAHPTCTGASYFHRRPRFEINPKQVRLLRVSIRFVRRQSCRSLRSRYCRFRSSAALRAGKRNFGFYEITKRRRRRRPNAPRRLIVRRTFNTRHDRGVVVNTSASVYRVISFKTIISAYADRVCSTRARDRRDLPLSPEVKAHRCDVRTRPLASPRSPAKSSPHLPA